MFQTLTDLGTWEFWAILGIALLVMEMMTFTYLALGFAIAALLMIPLALSGLSPGLWVWPIWAGTGVAFWYGLSCWYAARRRDRPDVNAFNSLDSLPPRDLAGGARWETPSESYDTDSRKHQRSDPGQSPPLG